MNNYNKLKTFFTLCIIFAGIFFSFEQVYAKKTKIEWKNVEGISRYEVKVRNKLDGKIREYRSTGDHIWVEVNFGLYEMKIAAYDMKGRMVSETGWILMTVMKTYQPELEKIEINKSDRRAVTLYGDSFFDKSRVVVRTPGGAVASNITTLDYPKRIVINTTLDKNNKYYIDVLNPGDYSVKKIAHVFKNDSVMLFDNEYQYSRYFAKFFVEGSAAWQIIHNNYNFSEDVEINYWKKTYNEGFTSYNMIAGYHLVSWFGFLGGLEYNRFDNNKNVGGDITVTTHYFIPQAGMFFSYKNKDFVPYISASAGYSFSYLDIQSEIGSLEYNSTDLYYNYGIGFKYFVFRNLYLSSGVYYSRIDLDTTPLDSVNLRLGIGNYF